MANFFPLTRLGIALTSLAVYIHYWFSTRHVDYVLYAASSSILVLIVGLVLLTCSAYVLARRRLRKAAMPQTLELETTTPSETGFVWRPFLLPLLTVEVSWISPSGVTVSTTHRYGQRCEIITATTRTFQQQITRRFAIQDIFGLSRLAWHQTMRCRLSIVPRRATVERKVLIQLVSHDGYSAPSGSPVGDYVDMRRYEIGDPLRHVLWKTYARSRKLMVRTPERAVSQATHVMIYFIAGPADDAVARVARSVLEQAANDTELTFMADGAEQAASNLDSAMHLLMRSSDFRDASGTNLDAFVDAALANHRSHCLIFIPSRPGPWMTRLFRATSRLIRPSVICAIDHNLPKEKKSRLRSFCVDDTTMTEARKLVETVQKLVEHGVHPILVYGEQDPKQSLECRSMDLFKGPA